MADIKISNLSGNDLFSDSESFMMELSDESEQVMGGAKNSDIIVGCLRPTCYNTGAVGSGTVIIIYAV